MIAALFALAAAMIIGGCAAVVQGFPYVRLESGLAMVIAGSVAASSGAVLCGLGVLALGFRRVERTLAQRFEHDDVPVAAPATGGEGRGRQSPTLPPAPAFLAPLAAEPSLDAERPRLEPSLGLRAETSLPGGPFVERPRPLTSGPDPRIPAAPLAARDTGPLFPTHGAQPAGLVAPEDDLFAAPEAPPALRNEPPALRDAPPAPRDEPPALRPALDAAPDPEPAAKPAARTVVGRYASGGNTYVMYEDGSIEAETPQGRFTFASLDELKAFVDGGGESGTRGAA